MFASAVDVAPTGLLLEQLPATLTNRRAENWWNMPEPFQGSAEAKFRDHGQVLDELRQAVREAKIAHPEIVRVLLFGAVAQGNWTPDCEANLIVVVRKEFPDFLGSRAAYQIFTSAIPTDSLVYSGREFEHMSADPESFLARTLPTAVEL